MTSAATRDEARRVRLGAKISTEPAVLCDLVRDPSITVRAALALNPSAPVQTNQALTGDEDERVRILLARKLTALAPSLSAAGLAELQRATWATLMALAADTAVRVRAEIANAVKDMEDAPRDLIRRLARDVEISVSEPVIRFSPLLTTADLIALVVDAPNPHTVKAVACRAYLDEAVSDAIAATADHVAICAMSANPSVQIREATLDALITRSVDHTDWHETLVRHLSLSARAASALAEIVATHLLEILANRGDLPSNVTKELRHRLLRRLVSVPVLLPGQDDLTAEQALTRAQGLAERHKLNETVLLKAACRGELRFLAALLAVAAEMPLAVVDRDASLHSAKGLISLAWKAGFTMRAATALQSELARLAPDAVHGANSNGGFPLGVEEMRWQLEFLCHVGEGVVAH